MAWTCGGGDLARELADSIDRLVIKVNPITLGAGIPLFGSGRSAPGSSELAAPPQQFDSGVVFLDYHRLH